MIERSFYLSAVQKAFKVASIVGLLGPRQCGKTTLARQFASLQKTKSRITFFDLENPRHAAQLEDSLLALENLTGWVIIDEVQRAPHLFEVLRVLADRKPRPSRFLLLGSASRDLIRQSFESLAGRISYVELPPFSVHELAPGQLQRLWVRGGFPPSFSAASSAISEAWREAYISTYLERDLPALGIQIPARSMRRFWMMLVHYHGHILNASEIGASLGIAHTTVQHYLDVLSGTFMMRQLPAWTENIKKRQVKASKIFFRDSGLYHSLLGIQQMDDLQMHPKLGASWEGFALEETIRALNAPPENSFFWATHNEAELDLLIFKNGKRFGFEIKHTSTPRFTPSMRIALQDLKLDSLTVVYPGNESFSLGPKTKALGLRELAGHVFQG